MITSHRGCYLSNRGWFQDVIDEDVILRYTSALEHLQLFSGYINQKTIEVYSLKQGKYENIHYKIIDDFGSLDVVEIETVRCTSANSTFNDMLADDDCYEQSLVEGLSTYYFEHNESYEGLSINLENMERFNILKGGRLNIIMMAK